MPWLIEQIESFKHIWPDDEVHEVDRCRCLPEYDEDLIVHNSFDGREYFERNERKPS
jgi:hypothetical protein